MSTKDNSEELYNKVVNKLIEISTKMSNTSRELTPEQAQYLLTTLKDFRGLKYELEKEEENLSKEVKKLQTYLFGLLEVIPGYNEDELLETAVGNAKSCVHNLYDTFKCRREFCKKVKKLIPSVGHKAIGGEIDDEKFIEWIESQISLKRKNGIYEVKVNKEMLKPILAEYFETENVFHIFGSQEDFPPSHFEWISPLPIHYTQY